MRSWLGKHNILAAKKEIGKLRGIGKIQYPARTIGMYLAIYVWAANQYHVDLLWHPIGLSFAIFAFIYPHLAVFIYWRSGSSKKVEHNMLLFDAFFSGATAAIIGFNFIPTVALCTTTAAGAMISRGVSHFGKAVLAILLGVAFSYSISGFDIELQHHNEFSLLLAVAIFLIIYVLMFAFASNQSIIEIVKIKRLINKQKEEIDLQKIEIESKNEEIMDSINYARRIQAAILPPEARMKTALPNSFVLYKPKDVVAGDFYWLHESNEAVLFAAADCTGHGVPGAMVSVVCNNALNRSVREYNLKQPGEILDKAREIVIAEFESSEEDVKDGMDIAICSLQGNRLTYAGAHNPLWIIRANSNEIEEIKANKQPIGKFLDPEPYSTHEVTLEKGDTIYIFSDGFADQFGGDKGKKFKAANFKKLLLSIQDQEVDAQKESIDNAFENWKGSLEQLDDVCVIGLRL